METITDSVCPLDCPDTCSLAVTVESGRVTKVDGSTRNPVTEGYICAKVRRYPERAYSPLRMRASICRSVLRVSSVITCGPPV